MTIQTLAMIDERFRDTSKYAKKIQQAIDSVDLSTPRLIVTSYDVLQRAVDYIESTGRPFVLDLETTGFNPYHDEIVGICLGAEGLNDMYIPIQHTDLNNNLLLNQLPENLVKAQINRLVGLPWVNHNIKFDYKFLWWRWDIRLRPHFDTYVAGFLLNENETSHGLKYLHARYVSKNLEDQQSFKELFDKVPFNYIPIEVASVYGANDVNKTLKLWHFQREYMYSPHLSNLRQVFEDIEMPLIEVLAEMELTGITLDEDRRQELEEQYQKIVDASLKRLYAVIDGYDYYEHPELKLLLDKQYKKTKSRRLNLQSSIQKQLFVFEVMGFPVLNKRSPEAVDAKFISLAQDTKLKPKQKEFIDAYAEYNKVNKLLRDFIIGIKSNVEIRTGAIHTNFNSLGTATGRFSSSSPNLQQIPSHNKDIRKMFVARPGHVLISSDYSTIEPRVLASVSDDTNMKEAFAQGRDVYASMASMVFNVPYEECLEFHPETGEKQPEGKNRRTQVKSVLLGLMYDRSASAIAEQFGQKTKWGQDLMNSFFEAYPSIKLARTTAIYKAEKLGYVETIFGRKRRLPVMKRRDNSPEYRSATRKCLNAVIQGSSADIMKLAMVTLRNNKVFRETEAKILLTIHDELVVECPEQYAKACATAMSMVMKQVAYEATGVAQKCDVEITRRWTGEEVKWC